MLLEVEHRAWHILVRCPATGLYPRLDFFVYLGARDMCHSVHAEARGQCLGAGSSFSHMSPGDQTQVGSRLGRGTLACCLRFSTAVIQHQDQKASWRGQGLFGFYFQVTQSVTEGSQGKNSSRAGVWRPWPMHPAFSYYLGPPGQGCCCHSDRVLPHQSRIHCRFAHRPG